MSVADDPFVDRVMVGVERRRRRLPLLLTALGLLTVVLAIPAVVALRMRGALAVTGEAGRIGTAAVLKAVADNPVFWAGVVVAVVWLGWLVLRATGGRR